MDICGQKHALPARVGSAETFETFENLFGRLFRAVFSCLVAHLLIIFFVKLLTLKLEAGLAVASLALVHRLKH